MVVRSELEPQAFRGLSTQPCQDNGGTLPRGHNIQALALHPPPPSPSLDVTIKPLPRPHTFRERLRYRRQALDSSALSLLISILFPSLSNSEPLLLSSHSFSAHFENIVDRTAREGGRWRGELRRRRNFYFILFFFFSEGHLSQERSPEGYRKETRAGVGHCFTEVTSILDSFRLILKRWIFFCSLKKKSNLQGLYSLTKGAIHAPCKCLTLGWTINRYMTSIYRHRYGYCYFVIWNRFCLLLVSKEVI